MGNQNNREGWQIYLAEKLDAMHQDIASIKVDVAKNTVSLDEHIKRTNLLEEELKAVKKDTGWLVFPVVIIKKLLGIK